MFLAEPAAWIFTPRNFSAVSGKICPCHEGSGRLGDDGEEDAMPFIAGTGVVTMKRSTLALFHCKPFLVKSARFVNMSWSIKQLSIIIPVASAPESVTTMPMAKVKR